MAPVAHELSKYPLDRFKLGRMEINMNVSSFYAYLSIYIRLLLFVYLYWSVYLYLSLSISVISIYIIIWISASLSMEIICLFIDEYFNDKMFIVSLIIIRNNKYFYGKMTCSFFSFVVGSNGSILVYIYIYIYI